MKHKHMGILLVGFGLLVSGLGLAAPAWALPEKLRDCAALLEETREDRKYLPRPYLVEVMESTEYKVTRRAVSDFADLGFSASEFYKILHGEIVGGAIQSDHPSVRLIPGPVEHFCALWFLIRSYDSELHKREDYIVNIAVDKRLGDVWIVGLRPADHRAQHIYYKVMSAVEGDRSTREDRIVSIKHLDGINRLQLAEKIENKIEGLHQVKTQEVLEALNDPKRSRLMHYIDHGMVVANRYTVIGKTRAGRTLRIGLRHNGQGREKVWYLLTAFEMRQPLR